MDHLQLQATPTNLLTISHDLLIEIISRLDWQDIVRLRQIITPAYMQTCHVLHNASKSRAVWLSLYERAQSSRVGKTRLETPVELCTDDDLELRTLRLLTSEVCWDSEDPIGIQRNLPRKTEDVLHIVEGGRWLLAAKSTGSVVYYDLDEEDPSERVLIPDQFEECLPTLTSDSDASKEGPFHIALHMYTESGRSAGFGQTIVQIWQVAVQVDSSDLSFQLVATKLTSFRGTGQRMLMTLSLCGDLVSYFSVFSRVVVVEWTSIEGDSMLGWTPLWQSSEDAKTYNLSLASGSKLVLLHLEHISILDLSDRHDKSTHSRPMTSCASWVIKEPIFYLDTISRPFFSRGTNTVRFVLVTNLDIYGLILPFGTRSDQDTSPPQFVKLQGSPVHIGGLTHGYHYSVAHPYSVALSHPYSVAHPESSELVIINHPWPDEPDWPSKWKMRHIDVAGDGWTRTLKPLIDELSGRIVLTPAQEYLSVLDFALTKPPVSN
ncbi:hypothetical protein CVT26_004214 [Gymnopilus dilepis]|uniref:F-box domain-containing protein n=1 Tax=Gymnopilus dilepis TaxID=231916 RepID=A0A409YMZ2_9AGAR|nr:hypothetical protein CVT26_004214 [Gymnopilus dilepis]